MVHLNPVRTGGPPSDGLTAAQRRVLGKVVGAQCFGMLTQQMLTGGLLLLYLNALGAPPARIIALLSVGPLLSALLGLPLAWLSDRAGIKIFGAWGNGLIVAGMALLASAGACLPYGQGVVLAALMAGLCVHTLGSALFNSGWFALLSHVVPSGITGRFFAVLRSSWQLAAIACFGVSALFFSRRTPVAVYQALFALGALSVALRGWFYRDIPEAPTRPGIPRTFRATLGEALRLPGLARYLAFLLPMVLVTGNAADMLRLSASRGSGFGDDQVLYMSVAGMIGALAGFSAAGPLADRYGPARLFLGCRFAFAFALALFPARHYLQVSAAAVGIAAAALLGSCSAALGIAVTSQSFATCVGAGRTTALAMIQAVQTLGAGLGGFILAGCLARLRASSALAVPVPDPVFNPFDKVLLGLAGFIFIQAAWQSLLSVRAESRLQGSPA
jgi:MFS family permease